MPRNKKLNIVLAGQANVGKSVIFNHLTGLHQHIGNWPGKTVEKAEGTLYYKGYTVDVLDLPGIYSLATYSIEELVSREYIAAKKPDFVVNVVDATNLERNLLFTLQLLELERPTVLALNMVNLLEGKGIKIDTKRLQKILGIPVVPVVAIKRKGLTEVLNQGIKLARSKKCAKPLKCGKEVEERIKKIIRLLKSVGLSYPKRWVAVKLLEKDKEIERLIKSECPKILKKVESFCRELKKIHGHDSSIIIAHERCYLVSQIIEKVQIVKVPSKKKALERFDSLTTHRIWGYPTMLVILASMFLAIFKFGDWLSGYFGLISRVFQNWYFFLALCFLEDFGYLARVAFLLDSLMHKLGVHGKASICLMLGFGCNVPACLSCRIMETQRERFLTGFLTTLVPCSAVTVIIMGLVGKFVGIGWAIGLYIFSILIILGLGRLASKVLPGETTELIMEMPDLRRPNFKTILIQTWIRVKDFFYVAAPLVIISGVIIEGIHLAGGLEGIAQVLSPITVRWLGLPAITGILLIFGVLRKELILVMLAALLGTANFAQVLSPVQMITLAVVTMLYIPCIATIAALGREFGWKKALGITTFEVFFAIGVGGIVFRLVGLFI